MKLSDESVCQLQIAFVKNIHSRIGNHDRLERLVHYFRGYGSEDFYHTAMEATTDEGAYMLLMLRKFNETDKIREIIIDWLLPKYYDLEYENANVAAQLRPLLENDGYKIVPIQIDQYGIRLKFDIQPIIDEEIGDEIDVESLFELNETSINNAIAKAKTRLNEADYSGAVTLSRTLLEQVLKILHKKLDCPDLQNPDLKELHKAVMAKLKLLPGELPRNSEQQKISQACANIVQGLSEFRNKMGDSHATQAYPTKLQAKFAVNITLALCEFLVGIYQEQYDGEELQASEQTKEELSNANA